MRRLVPLIVLLLAVPARAGEPEVTAVEVSPDGDAWRFEVTVRHGDEGWDHYADAWEVLAPDGTRLGLRELLHPHVDEQPFTRALNGVAIPDGVGQVGLRARDSVHGWGGTLFIDLPR